ncbi:hypothetical protein Y032_0006g2773 [Ancylostoma ceylanicum]|uniref:Sodium / potassium ATPase beta chain n=1 Tax=Ancylostoma ceylanicum TaxID=53326 RepID=A0A016VNE2_9BILA|nr:hypothetical protein Y032_0006g2773 [Ancylostoma ceylanicum]
MSSGAYTAVTDDVQMTIDETSGGDRWDDTGPIIGELRDRPAVSITLREILIDPHLRVNQRIFCLGTFFLLCTIVVILFIFLLVGFNRVMTDIDIQEHQSKQGLYMIPNFGTGVYNNILNLKRDNVAKGRYVEIIRDYLEAYKKEQLSRANFTKQCSSMEKPPHAWCEFPLKVFEDAGCTAVNRYGYDSGEPCLLFELKLETIWTPRFTSNVTELPFRCDAYDHLAMRMNTNIKYIPLSNGSSSQYGGFPLNKIPSRAISDNEGRDVSDENGETLYDQPPLIMVKLRLSRSKHTTVHCYIANKSPDTSILNLSQMPGNRAVQFDILYPYGE